MTYTPSELEWVAQRTAELVCERLESSSLVGSSTGLVDARTAAVALGVSREYIYDHAVELKGWRLTGTTCGPWRFDLRATLEAHTQTTVADVRRTRRRKAAQATGSSVPLLPIRDRDDCS